MLVLLDPFAGSVRGTHSFGSQKNRVPANLRGPVSARQARSTIASTAMLRRDVRRWPLCFGCFCGPRSLGRRSLRRCARLPLEIGIDVGELPLEGIVGVVALDQLPCPQAEAGRTGGLLEGARDAVGQTLGARRRQDRRVEV